MRKMKLFYIVLFVVAISSLYKIHGIYAYFTKETNSIVNELSIEKNTSYTVIHEVMNVNGEYEEHSRENFTNIPIGTEVTPDLLPSTTLPAEGFIYPATQTVTLLTFNETIITYRYDRKQYTLTINDSNLVTTSTPSGTYYYGKEIHLIADENDDGAPFEKWSDDTTNRDYTFTLTGNKTIGPIYADTYTITYVPNNETNSFTHKVVQTQPIGNLPEVEYNDCELTEGSLSERNCTYYYELIGWYKEPGFVNKVDETFVPTEDTTLYAKWNKIYYRNDGPVEFDGSNYIDTGVILFNEENAMKNFIVTFTVDSYTGYNPTNNTEKRADIFADMNEVGEPYPGVQFFRDDTDYAMNVNSARNDKHKDYNTGYQTGQTVTIKRDNGIVYYKYDDGPFIQMANFRSFTAYFENPATFGAGINSSNQIFRYLIGQLSDMSVEITERPSYTIHYDANGGSGNMSDQSLYLGETAALRANTFTKENAVFNGWNTEPDGSGTAYIDNYQITSDLGNADETITLYAQWIPIIHYYVHFDANGGTGSMDDQDLIYNDPPTPLTENAFTRTGYEFRGWNTEPDGTGTRYADEEEVRNLSSNENDIVTLYAEWWKVEYNLPGDIVFDGTENTFIDTGINVFDSTNFNKDFEIRFTFKSVDSDQLTYTVKQPTIMNVRDESNPKGPGFMLRFQSSKLTEVSVMGKWNNSTSNATNFGTINTNKAPIEFVFKREGGVVTAQYFYGSNQSATISMFNQGDWNLNQEFATNVAFGGYFDGANNNVPGRFFKGTLADIVILMEE